MSYAAARQSPSARGKTPPMLAARIAFRSVGVILRRSAGMMSQRRAYSLAANRRPSSYHHHQSRPCLLRSDSHPRPDRTSAKPARKPGCVMMMSHDVPRELISEFAICPPLRGHCSKRDFRKWTHAAIVPHPFQAGQGFSRLLHCAPTHLVQANQRRGERHSAIRFKLAAIVAPHGEFK